MGPDVEDVMDFPKLDSAASAVERSVGRPLYAMVLRLQEAEITAHCFGDCGRAILAGLMDHDLGPLIPCAQDKCPHLEAQMDEPLWTAEDGRPVYLRRLTPNVKHEGCELASIPLNAPVGRDED